MNVAINGFGRIGRTLTKLLIDKQDVNVLAINDLTNADTLAHLFKYDSVHGRFDGRVSSGDGYLEINEKKIQVLSEKNPEDLPWGELGIDVVVDATGKFLTEELATKHLKAGAKQVILSTPTPDKNIPMVVLGVNDDAINLRSPIISNASCTTNNVAALIKVLNDHWRIKEGYITTVHSMTGDQNLHDAPHKDLRRARAASESIIPTTTGAAKAITNIFPHLEGKLGGAGIRVPVLNGSLTDFTCLLESQPASVAEINEAFKLASETTLKGILEYTEDPIVSVDILGNPHSCVFDARLTSIVGGMIKVVGWYDNEFGYSSRLADLIDKINNQK
ncbi:glyceraldehyde-3-phosphate dehydrogenase [Pseudopedobacter saltans DSM 12145]|uniref:Glyceraldehyde-3-phosphate dehydrogenase n=1 Tax=Pseudopedobacter saltans (strain ATCC 51119 / DSM 12145 / JCM 21818 / CCUG 39354 / LMG 10337 / NBRC 100064 / NCIMB 13643) TaxID=762903 RepID=F0SCV7_PSESL|nr:type I glyceraldehyde-3-phosphate dehydrogenase [Pseudopedobacter saltans]ADY50696.1 glyceraldehyde-3-phosphate dehydrogenase [Pseudopedobacter saltans DSM 12145]